MKKIALFIALVLYGLSFRSFLYGQGANQNVKQVKVYYEPSMFGGWPANHGIWIWGNEILVGFTKGYYENLGSVTHNIDEGRVKLNLLARSLDGGENWSIEDPGVGDGDLVLPYNGENVNREDVDIPEPIPPTKINFKDPNLAFTIRMTSKDSGEARYWYSYDKGIDWIGPSVLPNFGLQGTAARTDYIIDGKNDCILFLTIAKSNGKEGRVMCVKTEDGGETWSFLSWIGAEPDGFSIMPASVRISDQEILVTTRRREGSHRFISAYRSKDNGISWNKLGNPVEDTGKGNPPALVKMNDGRICLIYGYRAEVEDIQNGTDTSDIRAKISTDNGETWSKDYILRNDGSGWDIGYPRVVQRPDGKIVALYYFMDEKTGPERYIGATIWNPPGINNN